MIYLDIFNQHPRLYSTKIRPQNITEYSKDLENDNKFGDYSYDESYDENKDIIESEGESKSFSEEVNNRWRNWRKDLRLFNFDSSTC